MSPGRRWRRCVRSAGFLFDASAALLLGSTVALFAWLTFSPFPKTLPISPSSASGCRPDGEGSWSIGLFYGDSPFSLKPIEFIYMMPQGSEKEDLRLYRAVNFPLRMESLKSGTASSLLGPWKPHKQNSVRNMGKSLGARNAGRPFTYKDELYRPGQDCGGTYGQRIRLFNVKVLAKDEYEEIEVPLGLDEPQKGSNAWNGARYHHLDVQQLMSDQWVAVMDGDRVPSGDVSRRLLIGYSAFGAAIVLVILSGVFLSAFKCNLPLSQCCLHFSRKRSDVLQSQEHHLQHCSLFRWHCSHLNNMTSPLGGRIRPNTCTGQSILAIIFVVVVSLTCIGTHYVYGGNGAGEAYSLKGHYSQFTLVTMTYDARLWNLKMYVKHYSRCTSIREILVVWNKGQPPNVTRFDSAVPLRIRVEKRNSLNNRYRDEKYAREQGGYNMILTGAAFMDHKLAFERYWSNDATIGRDIVDKFFNCEDLLLNFLYANASSSSQTIEYVKPSWALDTSKFSGVAISRNTQEHYQVRSECLARFSELYGDLAANKRS
ncbi:hypothetical protein BHE74_00013043 [Ensete ventricosum]|nr:hypothetical protein BHE74_00013043 [Ensete ventricosum]